MSTSVPGHHSTAGDPPAGELSGHLEQLAVTAARAVGDPLRAAFAAAKTVEHKTDFHDLVTVHDRRTEERLCESLTRAYPDSRVHAEESGRHGDGAVEWLIDPIDGTANFAFGLPFFAVSVAAALDGQLLAGVVYEPMRDVAYSASLRGASRDGVPLRSAGATRDQDSLLITSYPGPETFRTEETTAVATAQYRTMVRRFGAVRRLGSTALALAYVASGAASAAYASGIRPWDVAAGCLIVTQAGGRYHPLPATAPSPWLAPGYLATTGSFDLENSCLRPLLP